MKEKPLQTNDSHRRSKDRVPELTGHRFIDSLLGREAERRDQHGNLRISTFHSAERFLFDFNQPPGWEQFDTTSDAWFFGIWVNPTQRKTLCYAEGDIDFMRCKDAESYDREIARLCVAFEPGAEFTTIDFDRENSGPVTVTRHFQSRSEFFIDAERGARFIEDLKAERDAGEE